MGVHFVQDTWAFQTHSSVTRSDHGFDRQPLRKLVRQCVSPPFPRPGLFRIFLVTNFFEGPKHTYNMSSFQRTQNRLSTLWGSPNPATSCRYRVHLPHSRGHHAPSGWTIWAVLVLVGLRAVRLIFRNDDHFSILSRSKKRLFCYCISRSPRGAPGPPGRPNTDNRPLSGSSHTNLARARAFGGNLYWIFIYSRITVFSSIFSIYTYGLRPDSRAEFWSDPRYMGVHSARHMCGFQTHPSLSGSGQEFGRIPTRNRGHSR